MTGITIAGRAAWLGDAGLQRLLSVLSQDGEQARIAGGAVRNALLAEPVTDIDIATTNLPDQTVRRAEAAGFKTVPTGIEHGTVTIISGGKPFEVTTLRADVETDGRRARVVFGRDWLDDAERRDFTINALYAEADGQVIDLVGGLSDLRNRTLRFIGDPEERIREDYLRILRFFRFFAWYGSGRPDADGLRACGRLKQGLDALSAERVWAELRKLLSAPDPTRSMLWMRQSGVLSRILPESEKWGIDAIHGVVDTGRDLGWTIDPLLRLIAIVPPDPDRMEEMSDRLRLSGAERQRLVDWAESALPKPDASEGQVAKAIYRGSQQGTVDRLRLALAGARVRAKQEDAALIEAGGYSRLLAFAQEWEEPEFPVRGSDLTRLGVPAGPEMGRLLEEMKEDWIESGFALGRDALLRRVAKNHSTKL